MTEKLVPKLRFNFSSPWKTCKFKDVCSVEMGQSPSSNNYTENSNDTILVQGNADLCNGKVVPRLYTSEVTKVSKPGEIILTVRAPVGDIAINEYNCCIGRGVCSIEGNKFIYYLLNYFKETRMWNKYAQGSTFEAISSKDIKNLKINIPSAVEQEKISKFLSLIDKKINLLNNDLSQYNNFKKYLLQNIFAQKLRFDFNDEWKKVRLNDVLESSPSNLSLNDLEDNEGNYDLYGATGIVKAIDFYEKKVPYLAIVKDGAGVGKSFLCKPYTSIVGTMQYLTPKEEYDLEFSYYLLKTINFRKYIVGSTIPHIYFKDYSKEKIKVPSLKEQEKIGNLISNIDRKINLTKNHISQMEDFKNGLLQSLFI